MSHDRFNPLTVLFPSASQIDRQSNNVKPFSAWLPIASPEFTWDWKHLKLIRSHLADVTLGTCKRLILTMPPQHGKTELVTVRYPVWRIARDPKLRVAITSYGQRQANKYSRKARRVGIGHINFAPDRNSVEEWETWEGGSFITRGVGAGITGNPVDLLVIDDPYKDAKQAFSTAYRETVWSWWTDSLKTRLSKDAAVIVIHTRWKTDDLAGRLEKEGGWRVVTLPAIAEPTIETPDPVGRAWGEPLCDQLHPLSQLEEFRKTSPISFRSLYQQKPLDLEGGFFKGLEKLKPMPMPLPVNFTHRVRFWDLASTESQAGADPDYTVGVLIGKHNDGTFWVLNVIRDRVGPKAVRELIRSTAAMDGRSVPIRVEREGGASGKMVADQLVTETLVGFSALAVRPDGGKAERAEPFASQVEAGNVRIAEGEWNTAYLDELRAFPNGNHDDQVDGSSGGFLEVAKPLPRWESI